MASPTKPTILLLQGTFQIPDVYYKFAQLLESPASDFDFTKKALDDDIQVVETAIRKLVEHEGKRVLVFMHSYGGLVGAEAVPDYLTLARRRARDLPGGVARLFYLAAFVLQSGQSVATAVGDSPDHDHWEGRFKMRNPASTSYSDLPAEEAAYWAARAVPQSNAVKSTAVKRCAYTYVPSTYVVCNGDKAVPPQVQELFAKQAGAEVKRIEAGHSAFLSKPEEVLALVEEAAGVIS